MTGLSGFNEAGGWATVAAVALGVPALIFGVLAYVNRRQAKTLDWMPVAISLIIARPVKDISDGLSMTWRGSTTLETPASVKIRIVNTGDREIDQDDYLSPIHVEFAEAICYDAVTLDASPGFEKPTGSLIATPGRAFDFTPPTLNVGEWIELQMIVDGKATDPAVTCRIKGQTRPMSSVVSFRRRRALLYGTPTVIVGIASVVVLETLSKVQRDHDGALVFALILVAIFGMGGGIGLILNSRAGTNVYNWGVAPPPSSITYRRRSQ